MPFRTILLCLALGFASQPAAADFTRVSDKSEFLRLVSGKTLTRPLIRLQVTTDGRIKGKGARWPVTGGWSWRDGFFCRDLFWGGDPLGYNCQEVRSDDGRIRFTSDKGAGRTAVFQID